MRALDSYEGKIEVMEKSLRESKVWKEKRVWAVFLAEAVILLFLILRLFGRTESIAVDIAPGSSETFQYQEDMGGWYIREENGAGELLFQEITLKAGVYRVELQYATDTDMINMCTVEDAAVSYDSLLTNGSHLYAGKSSTDYDMWLLEGTQHLSVHVTYGGTGTLLVTGLILQETNALARISLFVALVLFTAGNLLWYYSREQKKGRISADKRNAGLLLTGVILLSSMPLMMNYVVGGGDIVFHMMRIEGIKDGLLSGQFPVRIPPEWLCGHGYASSVFYGDTLLYIPALLRMTGFTVQTSYKLFLLLLNAATCLTAYYCFRRIFHSRYLGVACSALYTLSVYRIYIMYCRAAVGETIGMLYLPLLVYGFYRVFTEEPEGRHYWTAGIPLCLGFAGLIQSHILSCELAGGFSVLLCLILWKKTFRKKTFLVLAGSVAGACLLSLWFLVPFLDYMLTGDFVIKNVSGRTIQERGLHPANLLFGFFQRGENAMNTEAAGIGITLLLAMAVFFAYVWCGQVKQEEKKLVKAGFVASGMGILAMVCSLSLFPWDALQRMNRVFAMLISSIQFPNRFLGVGTAALTLVAGIVGLFCMKREKLWKVLYGCGITVLLLCSSGYFLDDIAFSSAWFQLYNEESMTTGYIAGEEYLPMGTDAAKLTYRAPSAGEGVEIEAWEKEALRVSAKCSNSGGGESYAEVPVLFYKGYAAEAEGQSLTVCAGENNCVRVMLPAGFQGEFTVDFRESRYWRLAEVISAVSAVLFVGAVYLCLRKREKSGC